MGPEGEVSHGQVMLDQPILVFHNCLVLYCGLGSCLKMLFLLSGSLLVPSEVAEMHKKCSFISWHK